MSADKALYRKICESRYIPLYFRPWWLDVVCGPKGWDLRLSFNESGQETGVFVYRRTHFLWWTAIRQPPLSAYSGPFLFYPEKSELSTYQLQTFEKQTLELLIRSLPPSSRTNLAFLPGVQNGLPFSHAGYRQTLRYTYVFLSPIIEERLLARAKNTVRTHLKKAHKAVRVSIENEAAAAGFAQYRKTLRRKGIYPPVSETVFANLHHEILCRNSGECLSARGHKDGRLHAVLYLVFDEQRAGVLWTASFEEFRDSRAIYALYWAAIRLCAERGLPLDLEGSMDRGVEHLFRSFGAERTSYLSISRFRVI